jgi:hypothetical protein
MSFYAPAWLRRWRRPLAPILLAAGIAAFLALLLLPPFLKAIIPNALAMVTGAASWALSMLLLNGEPPPKRAGFEPARLASGEVVEYVAHYSEESASQAQAAFWLRSRREFRLGTTIVGPVGLAFLSALAWKLSPGSSQWMFVAGVTALSCVMPVILFFIGKRVAAAHAKRLPDRHFRIGKEGIAVGTANDALAWRNVVRVWETDAFLTLVLNPYMAIQLPKANMPQEAREIILRATAAVSEGTDR